MTSLRQIQAEKKGLYMCVVNTRTIVLHNWWANEASDTYRSNQWNFVINPFNAIST